MKRLISATILLFFMVCGPASLATTSEDNVLSINEGTDSLAVSLTKEVATKYFDSEKRPVIKVAVFDFTDQNGDITVGSRYISNRIKLAFGTSPQFALLPVQEFEKSGSLVYADNFEKDNPLRDRIVGEVKADVYIFGKIDTSGGARVVCQVDLWGIKPPYNDFSNIGSLKELKEQEKELKEEVLSPLPWRGNMSSSGLDFFKYVLVRGATETSEIAKLGNLGEVIFLSQPICDDLNLSWQVKADGMVYDVRQDTTAGTLRGRTGQIMQSRVKDKETFKGIVSVVKNFSFLINEAAKEGPDVAEPLEAYIVPKRSDLYYVPFGDGETGFRFMYLWAKRGRSKMPSSQETGKGWKLYVADRDFKNMMPVGTHTATATFEPITESEYGTKKPRPEYVIKFKFSVRLGLNTYVINYFYRQDQPEIFVRRLEIEGSKDEQVKKLKKITEIYKVYGGE